MAKAMAGDAVSVDPRRYSVQAEDERVRVVRVHYEVGDKSEMHSHPDLVAVFLSENHTRFTYPDGRTEEVHGMPGQAQLMPAMTHLPENIGNGPMDLVLVEFKK
ncbi:MAG TPA: hypothetical protein VE591_11610 [Candidatus Acidoferrum sp.]|nr:hypothetical protein [Candidatus Acidoferrum sp.]